METYLEINGQKLLNLPDEIWKPILSHYMISNKGRIVSTNYLGHGLLKLLKPCLRKGYERLSLYSKYPERKSYTIHRLVAEAFIPNPNNYPFINHKNHIRTFNHAENLEWCTDEYNTNYAMINFRKAKKLTEQDIKDIRKEYSDNKTYFRIIGEKYGVSYSTIGDIINHRTWSHLK